MQNKMAGTILIILLYICIVFSGPALAQEEQAVSQTVNQTVSQTVNQAVSGGESALDRLKDFESMSITDKKASFDRLNNEEKISAFGKLSGEEKENLFEGLPNDVKKMILQGMDEAGRSAWMEKHPDLKSMIDTGASASKPAVKPASPEIARESSSRIEEILSGEFPTYVSRELRQFGYSFFDSEISTFAPVKDVPVGPDYILGPGDNFTVYLWGKAENQYSVTVNREGRINLPRLGTLEVGGLTLAELKPYLFSKFKEYYPDFKMSVTMGALHTIEVFMVGEIKKPGTYNLSSLSSMISALYASGGPTKNGSLRNIRLYRQGKIVSTLDLYDFFMKGSKKDDLRLQTGDTILVPVIGPTVGVAGNVKRPAIYEMMGKQSIGQAIDMAGGVLPTGQTQNIVIERIVEHQRRVIRSFNLKPDYEDSEANLHMGLEDFDVIKIYPIHERLEQVIYLEGHVKYPRPYELKPGMRLKDVIPSFDYLLPVPFLPRAEIIRLVPPDLHPEIIEFNLGDLMSGDESQNLPLQDLDRVVVYAQQEKTEASMATIKGAVRRPGTYPILKGMKIKDLIFQAGNLSPSAFLGKADLSRVITTKSGTENVTQHFAPGRAIEGNAMDNLLLQKDDRIYIREIPKYSQAIRRTVLLEGEFLFPGEYTFSEGERLSSIIERAGGLTEGAFPFGALFYRESVKEVQRERIQEYISQLERDILTMSATGTQTAIDKDEALILQRTLIVKQQLLEKLRTSQPTGRMVVDLEEILYLPSSEYNIEVRPGDRLIVQKRPDTVNVLGEVFNPTALYAEKDKTVGYYLSRVGGITENADDDQIYVVKANGTVISKSQQGFFGIATWDSKNNRWKTGGFDSVKMDPGDTIIVPQKMEKFPWIRTVKDVTQIMFQIAVAAGVIIAAF